ncbi:MAG: FAD-dependent oxidoreductase, partial [Herbiconiux sp.]|nr:FAD-dependent oxidoreductase [Herbiconiux sp.]
MGTTEIRNGEVSFWYRSAGLHAERPALAESTSADVVIVGAGMTGLWTAHYLAEAMPSWRILVLEAEAVSYGASGRNGGWLSYGMPGLNRLYARTHGRDAVIDFQRAIIDSIGEVISVLDREGIEADVAHEGEVAIATTPAQSARLREEHEYLRDWGFGDGDVRPIGAAELARDFPRLAGARDGLWSPHGARVQP